MILMLKQKKQPRLEKGREERYRREKNSFENNLITNIYISIRQLFKQQDSNKAYFLMNFGQQAMLNLVKIHHNCYGIWLLRGVAF